MYTTKEMYEILKERGMPKIHDNAITGEEYEERLNERFKKAGKDVKNIIKMNFKDLLLFYAIVLSVTIFWQLLELLLYKEIKPDHI